MCNFLKLSVNIDHVATIRNARGDIHPDPIKAALLAVNAGANGITTHLREDRRHINDEDIKKLHNIINLPINFEMSVNDEMSKIALKYKPNTCCLVPEERKELTTEGGLNVIFNKDYIKKIINTLQKKNIRVSLFIDPNKEQIKTASEIGANIIELHVGDYSRIHLKNKKLISKELNKLQKCASFAYNLGLEVHAGHGLNYTNVIAISAIPEITGLNIGHFLIGESIFTGLNKSIKKIRKLMNIGRATIFKNK